MGRYDELNATTAPTNFRDATIVERLEMLGRAAAPNVAHWLDTVTANRPAAPAIDPALVPPPAP
jgi:hypothetical protein